MPDGCGLELLHEIRDLYPIRGIAITGYAHDYRQEQSLTAGYQRHLTKPIRLDHLLAALVKCRSAGCGRQRLHLRG